MFLLQNKILPKHQLGLVLTYTIVCLFFHQNNAKFASEKEEQGLRNYLLGRLTKNSPPAGMQNDSVFLFLDLYQIINVDEKNGILDLKFWIFLYYNMNESLWAEPDYSGVRAMQFPMDTFWRPDIG